VVFAIKDQYDTFDMRTTAGMDAAYANDRPPRDATFVKRLREAGAIILAKANLGEIGTPNSRSSFEKTHLYYQTDRSNKSVDIFDVVKNTFVDRVAGFVGFTGNGNTSGGNGISVVNNATEVWVGDGDSCPPPSAPSMPPARPAPVAANAT
jgi:hypothetical protein